MLSTKELEDIIRAIVNHVDYDAAKQLDPETAEEPEFADLMMAELVAILRDNLEDVQERLDWLDALEDAGVDNWPGIDFAHELMEEQ